MEKPVIFNPLGKYNLKFIDWQNQWQTIADSNYNIQNGVTQSPINGISDFDFYQLMLQQTRQMQYDLQQLQKQFNGLTDQIVDKVKMMRIGKNHKQCTICIKKFIKGQMIRMLPCKHIFHDQCILPWFYKNQKCPNCRMNIKQYFQNRKE